MVVVEYSYAAATTIDLGVVVLMSYYSLALLYYSLFSIYIIYMCTCCVFHRMRSMVDAECREREVGTFSIFFDWRGSSCRDSYSYQTFVTSPFSKGTSTSTRTDCFCRLVLSHAGIFGVEQRYWIPTADQHYALRCRQQRHCAAAKPYIYPHCNTLYLSSSYIVYDTITDIA